MDKQAMVEQGWRELAAEGRESRAETLEACVELLAQGALLVDTELFMSDIHGEYNAFSHVLRGGSGAVRALVEKALAEGDRAEGEPLDGDILRSLILYPREKWAALAADEGAEAAARYLPAMVAVARLAAARYPLYRVRALLPEGFGILEEVVCAQATEENYWYRWEIVEEYGKLGAGADLACALGTLIQHLVVNRLHLVGDVFDRGPAPDLIMEEVMAFPSVDVQWGNHDILWMGAAAGQPGSVANVVRICARYGNLSILEDAYGINLRPLAAFAAQAYAEDPCVAFGLKDRTGLTDAEAELAVKIQKAMALIQFKVEAALIAANPGFGLDDRNLLHRIDRERGTVVVDGVEYELVDTVFPTVDWDDPYALTPGEQAVIGHLCAAFQRSEKLQRHVRFLLDHGSLYREDEGILALHACVPLNPDGSLMEVELFGETYRGKSLYDKVDRCVREAFDAEGEARRQGLDMLWYLWLGPGSPLFAKSKMATFELYLIADKVARKEEKNAFYRLLDDEDALDGIFRDFGMNPCTSRIVCGHVPVKVKDGEDPVKAGGRVICIDGGWSAAYQKTTGLAGFTLVSCARGLFLDANEPLASREAAVAGADIVAERREILGCRRLQALSDTNKIESQDARIAALRELLEGRA